ncbi:MAG: 3-phosphoshikimate 1-carboxyvinyltransferase, partial [Alphaproteobacteria bacterium]|nr:3-phosphoshikimate 1-carboxyvinyltransferase [Alphaproteobacteria bacterium]
MPIKTATRSDALKGAVEAPGDKSLSHRALMFAALAVGESTITGLLESEDVLATAQALRQLGAEIDKDGEVWHVFGRGVGGLLAPEDVLDLGNSGTAVRLLMGLVATHPFTTVFTGDASLRRRPMERVAAPLRLFGAEIEARQGGLLPLTLKGTASPVPQRYEVPVPSAQVKSAVLLAALNTPGMTEVIEREATRDHTERMLARLGADIRIEDRGGARHIFLRGQPELEPFAVEVPGDPSSAAFPLVAGLLVPGSEVKVKGVGLNPLRTGLFTTLKEMGARLSIENERDEAGEPVGDITVQAGALAGVDVPPERAPSMIDEYPILAVAAAFAEGTTTLRGLAELRVKESDRLSAIAKGLRANGVGVEELEDGLIITGTAG